MRRMVVIVAIALFAGICSAQQPDVRVRLLSLYRLSQIAIVPGTNTSFSWNASSIRTPLHAPAVVRARDGRIEVEAQDRMSILLFGDFRIVSDSARTMVPHVPVEVSARNGSLRIIGRFPLEDYVAAVLQGETAGQMPPNALKALAVAIRSYATHFRERHKDEGFDFCDTTHCQYLRTDIVASVRAAVDQTSGELLWDKGVPLAAYYHKDCGGRTEAAAVVWPDQASQALTSHQDSYCVRATTAWRAELTRADLDRMLTPAGLALPRGWDRITIFRRTPSGRALTLRIGFGSAQQGVPVSASSFRFAIGRSLGWSTLKSDWYDVNHAGDRFVFTGRGVGHGVGLCQTGAAEMARQGKTYREILAFYYTGAPIGRSAQGIPWRTVPGTSFDVLIVNPEDISNVQSVARSAMAWALNESGLKLRLHPVIQVYPSVAMYRNATGEPGWVAASTRRDHVRLEPPSVLGRRLEDVLRHEFLHMLVESNASQKIPLWFREGLVVYLTGEKQGPSSVRLSPAQIDEVIASRRSQAAMKNAYAAAAALVSTLDRQYGRAELMHWLGTGIPSNVLNGSGASPLVGR
jgi:stage II sporulation protein D